jgi:hypothetical protein
VCNKLRTIYEHVLACQGLKKGSVGSFGRAFFIGTGGSIDRMLSF